MIRRLAALALAACTTREVPHAADPVARPRTEAWQMFAADAPFKSWYSAAHGSWAVGHPRPPWINQTWLSMSFDSYDGAQLSGDVELHAEPGLDPEECAIEVIWEHNGKRGLRIEHATSYDDAGLKTTDTHWRFVTHLDPAPAIVDAMAIAFCPIDRAHVRPPWGVDFGAEARIAGPRAHDEICGHPRSAPAAPSAAVDLARPIELSFVCGVLPRLRGDQLVDECSGDLLLDYDELGRLIGGSALAFGAPLDPTEIDDYLSGSPQCSSIELRNIDAAHRATLAAAIERLRPRLARVENLSEIDMPTR